MNAKAKFDALIRHKAGVAIDHRALDFDCASRGVDHAAKLDDGPVARAIDDPSMVERDCRVDEVAAQGAQPWSVLSSSAPASLEKPATSVARMVVSLRCISGCSACLLPNGTKSYHRAHVYGKATLFIRVAEVGALSVSRRERQATASAERRAHAHIHHHARPVSPCGP